MYTVARRILFILFFATQVFADLPSHVDLVAADVSTSALSVPSVTTDSDILILIPPASEQYTLLSESSLSSVTEITKLLQNAFVSAISTEANTQTSQQLYSLELLNSSLHSLTVSEPLRELLKSYTQILLEVFERQPPKSETLALAMIHALFLENLYGIQALPEQNELIQSEVIQNHPLLLEIAGFRPLIQSRSHYNRLQLLERADQLEIRLRQNPGIQAEVRAQILSALKSFAEGKDKTQELAQSWINHQKQNRENHQTAPRSGSQFISMPDLKLSLIPTDGDARVRLTGTVNWCGTTYGGGGSCWPHDWLTFDINAKNLIDGAEGYSHRFRIPLNTRIVPGAKVDIQTEEIFRKFKAIEGDAYFVVKPGKHWVRAAWGANALGLYYVPNFSVEWEGVEYIADGAKPPEGMTVSLDTLSVTQEGSNPPAKSDKIYLSTKRPVKLESRLSKSVNFTDSEQYEFEFLLEIEGKTQSLLKQRINASTFSGGDTIVVAMNLLPLEMKELDGKDGKITSSLKRFDYGSKTITKEMLIDFTPSLSVKVLGCDEPKAEVSPASGILSDYYNVLNCSFEVVGNSEPDEYSIRITEHTLSLMQEGELAKVISDRGSLALNAGGDSEPLIDGISEFPRPSSLFTKDKKFSFRFIARPVYFNPSDISNNPFPYLTPQAPLIKFHVQSKSLGTSKNFTTIPVILPSSSGTQVSTMIFALKQPEENMVSHQGMSNPFWFAKSVEQLLEYGKNIPYINQMIRQLDIRYGMEKKVQREIVPKPYVVYIKYAHITNQAGERPTLGIFQTKNAFSLDYHGEIAVEARHSTLRNNAFYRGAMEGIPPNMSFQRGLMNVLLHELRHAYQQVLAHTNHAHNPDGDHFVPCRTLSTQFSTYGYGQCDRFKDGLTVKGIQKFQEIDHGFLIDPLKYQVGTQTAFLGCNLMPGNQFAEGIDDSKADGPLGLLTREADAYYFGWWFSNTLNDKTPLPVKTIPSLPVPELSDPPANLNSSITLSVKNPPLICHFPINTVYKIDKDWIQSEDHSIPLTFHKVANQCVLQNGSIVNKTEKTLQVQFRGVGNDEKVVSGIKTASYSFSGLDKIPQNVKSCDEATDNLPAPILQEDQANSNNTRARVKVNNFPNSQSGIQIQIQVNGSNASASFNNQGKYIDIPFQPKYSYCTKPGAMLMSQTRKVVLARFSRSDYPHTVGPPGTLELSRPGVETQLEGYTCFSEPVPQLPAPRTDLNDQIQTKTFSFELVNFPAVQGVTTKVSTVSQVVGGVAQSDIREVRGNRVTINYRKLFSHCAYLQNPPAYSHQKQISLQYQRSGLTPGPITRWTQSFEGWDYHPGPAYNCHRE